MRIYIPKDAVALTTYKCRKGVQAFRFKRSNNRVSLPREIINCFPDMGADMFVSPTDKCLYITFVDKKRAMFYVNRRSAYISSKSLFEWATNANVSIHEDYQYRDYVVDKTSKTVKVSLVRK